MGNMMGYPGMGGPMPPMGMPPGPRPPSQYSAPPRMHHPPQQQQQQQQNPAVISRGPKPANEGVGITVTVFVGNITDRAPDNMIRQMLQHCGPVVSWKRVQGASGVLQGKSNFQLCDNHFF